MVPEDRVYFPLTNTETHGFICVRLFSEAGSTKAEASIEGAMISDADYAGLPLAGTPNEVLRAVDDLAAVRGLDIRIKLDGVDWDPALGSLVR